MSTSEAEQNNDGPAPPSGLALLEMPIAGDALIYDIGSYKRSHHSQCLERTEYVSSQSATRLPFAGCALTVAIR